jgi:putative membrane protein
LGLVNALIAPIVKALTCPLILLTLGLFTLVINGAMLWLAGVLSREFGLGFFVRDLGAAILGALVVSVVSFVLSVLAGVHRKER